MTVSRRRLELVKLFLGYCLQTSMILPIRMYIYSLLRHDFCYFIVSFVMASNKAHIVAIISLTVAGHVAAYPKIDTAEAKSTVLGKGVDLSSETRSNETELSRQDRPPRFGFSTYTSDVQGYSQAGTVVPGVYGPVKLDIGGLVLGTIVGLGAFFILPKLLHVAAPYGPYKRSEDEQSGDGTTISDIFARVQDSLNSYNVDSVACMQRAVCYSIQAANEKTGNSTVDNLVDNLASNDITKSLIDGTEWKRAVDVGESGGDCGAEFPKCPVSLDSVVTAIAKYLIS